MKWTTSFLATGAPAAAAGLSLAHEGQENGLRTGPVKKEQTAWGIAGDGRAATRTINITMSDKMRFTPDRIEVEEGETVKLVLKNSGHMLHEMVMGTRKELDEHAALMLRFPNMEHDEPCMAHVKPGTGGELVWTFNRPGQFDFECLVPGHYQAGMAGKIVTPVAPH